MDIYYLGHSAFKLKGKKVTVVTDPFDSQMVGLKFPKNTACDIVTISHNHPDHNYVAAVEKIQTEHVIFNGPGEYEARGVDVVGIATHHDDKKGEERGNNTVYKIRIDGVSIVHCGDLGHLLTDNQIGEIDTTDVLLVPVGGKYTIDAAKAAELVAQLEPSIVIPMHYKIAGMKEDVFGEVAGVSEFLKAMGIESLEPVSKLTVTKDKLPEETQVVVLEA